MRRFDLGGKVAVVTGGNGGIGLGMARGLAECGAAVVMAGRNAAKNEAALAELASIDPATAASAVIADVTDEEQCRAMVAEAVRRHGRLDILVNNAGQGGGKPPHEMPVAEWRAMVDANLTSVVLCSQAAYPEMKRAGAGKVVNVASLAAILAMPGMTAYAPAKAGVVQFSRVCAAAWARDNIQVNAVLPGWIATDMTRPRREDNAFNERVLARVPAGRWGTPDDLAGIERDARSCSAWTTYVLLDAREVVRRAPPAGGHAGKDALVECVVLAARSGHVGGDPARQDGVDLDVVARPGGGAHPAELHHPGLGRGVGGHAGHRQDGGERGDVDDLVPNRPFHLWVGGLAAHHHAGQVRVHHRAPLRHGELVRLLPDRAPGVVDQDVEPAVAADRLGHHRPALLLVGDVDDDGARRGRCRAAEPANSATAASFLAALRPATTTTAPHSARPRAMPRPMPPLPPVTTATLPVRSKRRMSGPPACSSPAAPLAAREAAGARGY